MSQRRIDRIKRDWVETWKPKRICSRSNTLTKTHGGQICPKCRAAVGSYTDVKRRFKINRHQEVKAWAR